MAVLLSAKAGFRARNIIRDVGNIHIGERATQEDVTILLGLCVPDNSFKIHGTKTDKTERRKGTNPQLYLVI